jgi:hypothetical protein
MKIYMNRPILILLSFLIIGLAGGYVYLFSALENPQQANMLTWVGLLLSAAAALTILCSWAAPNKSSASKQALNPVPVKVDRSEIDALQKTLEEVTAERDRIKKASLENDKSIRERIASAGRDDVLGLLGLLQEKGRFLDFVMDDVAPYTDQQIGSAARVVHGGCASVIKEYFRIAPVFEGNEGGKTTLPVDFDAGRYRLMGKVQGEPPFTGTVIHRGWQAREVKLPERVGAVHSPSGVIVPAEIEIS